MKTIALGFIRGYQKWISPAFGRRCKFHPTCSSYALTAISRHGAIRGTALAGYRLLRCHPWSAGGVDYAPAFGAHERRSSTHPPVEKALRG